MSRIHAKPHIRKVIDSLSDLQKVALLGLVNGETPIGGSANPTPKSLLNPSQYINGGDKNAVKYIALETAEGTYTGFLIYTDAYCCLVAYQDDSQNLDILDIDLSNMTYKVNGENTSIADMRFEIEQSKVVGLTGQIPYLSTEPSDPNIAGFVKIVVLDSDPSDPQEGFLYFVTE